MGFKKNNPGCNCCQTGCEITPITWTTDSGTWDTTSPTAPICSAAGNIHCNEAHPDGDITMRVTGTFVIGTGGGATADILVGWVDTTHYFYARYIRSGASSSIEIRRKNGASDTLLATSATLTINGSTFTFEVCVNASGDVVASLDGDGKVLATGTAITGTQMGLGHSGAGTVTFGSIVYEMSYKAGVEGTCEHCVGSCTDGADVVDDTCCRDTLPTDMDVTIPADWSALLDCDMCAAIPSGTFTLTYTGTSYACSGFPCLPYWGLNVSAGNFDCTAHPSHPAAQPVVIGMRFYLCCNASPNLSCLAEFHLNIMWDIGAGTQIAAWRYTKNYSTLIDCATQVFDLPWDSGAVSNCKDAGAYCTYANSANILIQAH